jgi:hypothetical protein
MKRFVPLAALIGSFGVVNLRPSTAIANSEPSKTEAPAVPAKKQLPPGLTGNKIPQCPAGEYVAGLLCKIAAPGYYLDLGMKYPAPCPPGTTSPAGARSIRYCE